MEFNATWAAASVPEQESPHAKEAMTVPAADLDSLAFSLTLVPAVVDSLGRAQK